MARIVYFADKDKDGVVDAEYTIVDQAGLTHSLYVFKGMILFNFMLCSNSLLHLRVIEYIIVGMRTHFMHTYLHAYIQYYILYTYIHTYSTYMHLRS